MISPLARAANALIVITTAFALPHQAACTTACVTDTIGLDASYANTSSGTLLGEAVGQTFLARDTLMEFLRVWRIGSQCVDWQIGMHPYILETDANGIPDPQRIVLDGPTIVIPDGDCVHPIEFKWPFDPPLALPHSGQYAFFLFQDPCQAHFDILATNQPSLYAEGIMWTTGRSNCRVYPQIGLRPHYEADEIFQIGFCREVETASRPQTWGRLKILYR